MIVVIEAQSRLGPNRRRRPRSKPRRAGPKASADGPARPRHPEDADLPRAAAGAGELEVGPGADWAVEAGHELELVDVIRPGGQVVAGPGRGQLVAVDDDVDLTPGEDLEQVLPLDLPEGRL